MTADFDFEQSINEFEQRIKELEEVSASSKVDLSKEISAIASKLDQIKTEIYGNLKPWQVVKVSRHINRPSTLDYIQLLCGNEFVELHGDRLYSDDPAIVAGFGQIGEHRLAIIGHQKGHDTEDNIFRNFGMPHPEGYRKAMRIMKMAEKFNLPIVTFIDTPGAFPGVGAEERGQSNAIAESLALMSSLRVPILCFVTGEGGSGGALALSVGDRIFMFEFSTYSVISPEGCASILWKDAKKQREAAEALKIEAKDLLKLGIIDDILPEPIGGAHRNHEETAQEIKKKIDSCLPILKKISADDLIKSRYEKFRRIGVFSVNEEF
ncbi:MAG: acetyl-CoA carboxylase carboxyltransferase subunit alpha [Candidatus Riflebacteria bacterium]|nr:acetyl-CoA carboxylase carboxyltransferase subunit alpha [Candidatus Riflebacteria bacterium]